MPEGSRGQPVRARSSTGAKAKILDAHVQFELDRWSGTGLERSLTEEVGALFAWLATVRVGDVLMPAQVRDGLARAARAQPAGLVRTIEQGARVLHEALERDESTVAELLPRERFDQLAGAVIGMAEVRQSVIAQIMGTSAYSQLVAHELYHGIKNYILKENILARRVPGASSLLKFGQSAFSSARPSLERSIDRQLESFINANVQDTVRDSQHHLDRTLNTDVLWSAAAEFWSAHADEQVATGARRLSGSSLDELLGAVREVWASFCRTPFFDRAVELLVTDFLETHGDRSVDVLLADLGITSDAVARELARALAPVLDKARDSGYLESRIRTRLDAFYSMYFPPKTSPTSP